MPPRKKKPVEPTKMGNIHLNRLGDNGKPDIIPVFLLPSKGFIDTHVNTEGLWAQGNLSGDDILITAAYEIFNPDLGLELFDAEWEMRYYTLNDKGEYPRDSFSGEFYPPEATLRHHLIPPLEEG